MRGGSPKCRLLLPVGFVGSGLPLAPVQVRRREGGRGRKGEEGFLPPCMEGVRNAGCCLLHFEKVGYPCPLYR